jgi:hypothetical protein
MNGLLVLEFLQCSVLIFYIDVVLSVNSSYNVSFMLCSSDVQTGEANTAPFITRKQCHVLAGVGAFVCVIHVCMHSGAARTVHSRHKASFLVKQWATWCKALTACCACIATNSSQFVNQYYHLIAIGSIAKHKKLCISSTCPHSLSTALSRPTAKPACQIWPQLQ